MRSLGGALPKEALHRITHRYSVFACQVLSKLYSRHIMNLMVLCYFVLQSEVMKEGKKQPLVASIRKMIAFHFSSQIVVEKYVAMSHVIFFRSSKNKIKFQSFPLSVMYQLTSCDACFCLTVMSFLETSQRSFP